MINNTRLHCLSSWTKFIAEFVKILLTHIGVFLCVCLRLRAAAVGLRGEWRAPTDHTPRCPRISTAVVSLFECYILCVREAFSDNLNLMTVVYLKAEKQNSAAFSYCCFKVLLNFEINVMVPSTFCPLFY